MGGGSDALKQCRISEIRYKYSREKYQNVGYCDFHYRSIRYKQYSSFPVSAVSAGIVPGFYKYLLVLQLQIKIREGRGSKIIHHPMFSRTHCYWSRMTNSWCTATLKVQRRRHIVRSTIANSALRYKCYWNSMRFGKFPQPFYMQKIATCYCCFKSIREELEFSW